MEDDMMQAINPLYLITFAAIAIGAVIAYEIYRSRKEVKIDG